MDPGGVSLCTACGIVTMMARCANCGADTIPVRATASTEVASTASSQARRHSMEGSVARMMSPRMPDVRASFASHYRDPRSHSRSGSITRPAEGDATDLRFLRGEIDRLSQQVQEMSLPATHVSRTAPPAPALSSRTPSVMEEHHRESQAAAEARAQVELAAIELNAVKADLTAAHQREAELAARARADHVRLQRDCDQTLQEAQLKVATAESRAAQAQAQLEAAVAEKDRLAAAISKVDEGQAALRAEQATLRAEHAEELRRATALHEITLRGVEDERRALQQLADAAAPRIAAADEQLQAFREKAATEAALQQSVEAGLRQRVADLTAEFAKYRIDNERAADATVAHLRSTAQQERDDLTAQVEDLRRRSAALQDRVDALDCTLETARSDGATAQRELDLCRARLQDAEQREAAEAERAQDRTSRAAARIDELEADLQRLRAAAEAERTTLQRRLDEALADRQSAVAALQELQQSSATRGTQEQLLERCEVAERERDDAVRRLQESQSILDSVRKDRDADRIARAAAETDAERAIVILRATAAALLMAPSKPLSVADAERTLPAAAQDAIASLDAARDAAGDLRDRVALLEGEVTRLVTSVDDARRAAELRSQEAAAAVQHCAGAMRSLEAQRAEHLAQLEEERGIARDDIDCMTRSHEAAMAQVRGEVEAARAAAARAHAEVEAACAAAERAEAERDEAVAAAEDAAAQAAAISTKVEGLRRSLQHADWAVKEAQRNAEDLRADKERLAREVAQARAEAEAAQREAGARTHDMRAAHEREVEGLRARLHVERAKLLKEVEATGVAAMRAQDATIAVELLRADRSRAEHEADWARVQLINAQQTQAQVDAVAYPALQSPLRRSTQSAQSAIESALWREAQIRTPNQLGAALPTAAPHAALPPSSADVSAARYDALSASLSAGGRYKPLSHFRRA
jgi:chromosome segregation ATPase